MKTILLIPFLISSILFFFISCNADKVTCDMKESIEKNQFNLRLKLTKILALKYASDDYNKPKKGYWDIDFTDEYKRYLKMNLDDAENQTGKYFFEAKKTLEDKDFIIEEIVPLSYNKEVNKCECEAKLRISGYDIIDKFFYDITRNSDGEIVGHYSYNPNIRIDNEEYTYIEHILKKVVYKRSEFDKRRQNQNMDREESWTIFWKDFNTAFDNKDKATIISLCDDYFSSGGSGDTPSQWFTSVFEDAERYSQIKNAIKNGVKDHTFSDGSKSKVTGKGSMGDLYFDFKENQWTFGGIIGD